MNNKTKKGWILFCLLISIMVFAVACSSGNGVEPAATQSSTNNNEEASTADSGMRVIQHAMGETEVSVEPKNIIVLDNGTLDNVLALDVKPVGAPTVFLEDPYPDYLKDQTEGIQNIGTIDEPNLETIASLNPDLILGSKDTHEAIYDKLKQIAPTVFVETLGTTWKENLQLQAEAIGKQKEAELLLSNYFARLDDFKAKMGNRLNETTISLLRPRSDHVRIYLKDSFSGSVIEDAGLPRPEIQNKDEFAMKVTEEQVADMDAAIILWFSRDSDNLLKSKLENNPLWSELKAVQTNQVYEVNWETWLSGLGYQAANLLVDDLYTHVLGE
jgi:iron complex transport system substrate-binding protein